MSLTPEISILDKMRMRSSSKWIPMQASLELTNRCNERCGHCYLPSFQDKQDEILSLSEWQKILEDLRQAGTLFLILMGGEAMLNQLFWDILKKANDLNFHSSMITNGLKIKDETIAKKLSDYGLINATISLYSIFPETHDRMTRVRGSHQKTLQAINFCRQAGIQVTINCLLTSHNIREVFFLEDWAMQNDLMVKFDPMITPKLDGNLEPTKLRASEEDLRWYFKEKIKRWPTGKPRASGESFTDFACNAGKGKCAITYSGDLLPCIEIREPLGNLKNSAFADLWENHIASKWRSIKWSDIEGVDQKMISFCDHCPGMAKNELGNAKKMTCYSKKVAEIKNDFAK